MTELSGTTAIVTGASRGFGRAIAASLVGAGARVVGVARDRTALESTAELLGDGFEPCVADVTDFTLPGRLFDAYRPGLVVLNAGARPLPRALQQLTWEAFSSAWETDVRQAFAFHREALLAPLEPGSTVIAVSSRAAIGGSPLSGGYAGAKATVRFVAGYAADESTRAGLGIRFLSLLPDLTDATGLGGAAVDAYARRLGIDVAEFLRRRGPGQLSPEQVGAAVLDLARGKGENGAAYCVTAEAFEQLG
ncbi:SDR family NAD(P)-dependent oxidoreductase [Actinospica robiniae]|uniref:SDR family NAD(P)-dependent oxidoreductase n=1 Tax=Actinospica robiniae TaxID=304901 RepID=UPI00041448E8|nr:SDR family oxidoreductase [Actinospica robiniae]